MKAANGGVDVNLESGHHLYQRPLYTNSTGGWFDSMEAAVLSLPSKTVHWDEAALLSMVCFDYICGNRTLIREVTRQPWLSSIDDAGQCHLEEIPEHGTLAMHPKHVARELASRLMAEAKSAADRGMKIYVLLSGGLDSRVVAAVFASLQNQGLLRERPIAVTWGAPNSRDAAYAALVAAELGWDAIRLDLTSEDLLRNVEHTACTLGASVSPTHLHRMTWFQHASQGAVVVNGSYGDSVGRAEFGARHVLELRPLAPNDRRGLINRSVAQSARAGLASDLAELRSRVGRRPRFAVCECEMQAHYMRGVIAHAMSIINSYCPVYHMFTEPAVYPFMWSVHPSLRGDSTYAELLELLNPALARLPWARTNRALRGRTEKAGRTLSPSFASYAIWLARDVNSQVRSLIGVDDMATWGLFDRQALEEFVEGATAGQLEYRYDLFAWLAALGRFKGFLAGLGRQVTLTTAAPLAVSAALGRAKVRNPPKWRVVLRNNRVIYRAFHRVRALTLRVAALLWLRPRFISRRNVVERHLGG